MTYLKQLASVNRTGSFGPERCLWQCLLHFSAPSATSSRPSRDPETSMAKGNLRKQTNKATACLPKANLLIFWFSNFGSCWS